MCTRLSGCYWLKIVNFVHEPYMKWFNLINLKLVTAGPGRLELNSAKNTQHVYSVPLQKATGGSKSGRQYSKKENERTKQGDS